MKIHRIWKKQLLCCIGFFFIMLALGLLFHYGFLIIIGAIVMCLSAVVAERGMLCPNCHESLLKEVMAPKAHEIQCPECETTITIE